MALSRFSRITRSLLVPFSSIHHESLRTRRSFSTVGSSKDMTIPPQPPPGPPSFDESMRRSNKLWNLGIKEEEYLKYHTLSEPIFNAFKRVNELYNQFEREIFPESLYPRSYTKPGYNNDKNPFNAWQCQCEIRPNLSEIELETSLLKGKKIVLKDSISVASLPMQHGSAMFQDYICNMDATVVQRILNNGGVIVGKSTCEDLCYSAGSHTSWPHPVKNRWDADYHAGGSSSGTAALVAGDELVDIGISGDQGGSIRIPACWCGVFGFKPTWGLVPYTGVAQICAHLDHIGPCAKNMDDLCALLTSIAGKDGIDIRQLNAPNYQSVETNFCNILEDQDDDGINNYKDGITIGILKEGFELENMDDSIATRVKDGLDKLMASYSNTSARGSSNNGARIKEMKEVSIPIHNDMGAIFMGIAYESQYTCMYQYGTNGVSPKNRLDPKLNHIWKCSLDENRTHLLSHTNKHNMMIGQYLLNQTQLSSFGEYFAKGTLLADKSYSIYKNIMNENNIDVLICPTLPNLSMPRPWTDTDSDTDTAAGNEKCPIETFTHAFSMVGNTMPFNVTGMPALTVPLVMDENINKTKNGGKLFAGMQIIGKLWDDKTVLKMGHIVEQCLIK